MTPVSKTHVSVRGIEDGDGGGGHKILEPRAFFIGRERNPNGLRCISNHTIAPCKSCKAMVHLHHRYSNTTKAVSFFFDWVCSCQSRVTNPHSTKQGIRKAWLALDWY